MSSALLQCPREPRQRKDLFDVRDNNRLAIRGSILRARQWNAIQPRAPASDRMTDMAADDVRDDSEHGFSVLAQRK